MFSSVGDDGYPKPIFHKRTGEIDHEVAKYWKEHYDLSAIMQRDWKTLGPKLAGKLHFYVGEADTFYLDRAVHLLKDFLDTTTDPYYRGSFDFGVRKPHCYTGEYDPAVGFNQHYWPEMVKHMEETAPPGADLKSWQVLARRVEWTLLSAAVCCRGREQSKKEEAKAGTRVHMICAKQRPFSAISSGTGAPASAPGQPLSGNMEVCQPGPPSNPNLVFFAPSISVNFRGWCMVFPRASGGFSRAYGKSDLNLGFTKDDARAPVERNRLRFLRELGAVNPPMRRGSPRVSPSLWPLITLRQIHSDIIRRVDSTAEEPLSGDGMITATPGLLLGIQVADCLPVILVDSRRHVVGVFHAGWRGTLKRIVRERRGRDASLLWQPSPRSKGRDWSRYSRLLL